MDGVWVVARALVTLAEVLLAIPLFYLATLSVAALGVAGVRRARGARWAAAAPSAADGPLPTMAVLIPAHDEAGGIAGAVASALALDYPRGCYDVYVIADNCTDATAARAAAAGATVYERHDEAHQAKGYALRWMLERLDAAGIRHDAYIVLDADSRLSPNFLRAMARALRSGAQVAQGQYRVLNAAGGSAAGLRAVAFALFNHVRPLGRLAFGWSAGLKGNGMCFARPVLERFGWGAYSLAEDAEYHLALVRAGIVVRYIPEAVVAAEMPETLRQSRTQQARWEKGRIDLARAHVGALVRGAVANADGAYLDAALEIVTPPLSLLVGLVVLVALATLPLGWTPAVLVAAILLGALALHVLAGIILARLSWRTYLSLFAAPAYIVWKCWVYLAALVGRGGAGWVRTQRAPEQPPSTAVGAPVPVAYPPSAAGDDERR